jgi:hypothetical protein
MRNLILFVGILSIVSVAPSHAEPLVQRSVPVVVAPEVPADVPAEELIVPIDPPFSVLATYVLSVMRSWPAAVPSCPAADLEAIARDVASVASNVREAVLLAGLGYWEGARFADYVDRGACNDPAWRASTGGLRTMRQWGDCDGGHAHSLWQIHPIVDVVSPLYGLCNAEAVSERVGAARCALAIARGSISSTGDLRAYTGEIWGGHPKADERLKFVQRAIDKHPFRLPKELPKE